MERKYYIALDRKYFGPFTISELQEKSINPNSLIWYEGLEQWTTASKITELKDFFISTPPEIPLRLEFQKKRKNYIKIFNDMFHNAKNTNIGLTITFWVFFVLFAIHYIFIFVPHLVRNGTSSFPYLLGGMIMPAIVLSIIWTIKKRKEKKLNEQNQNPIQSEIRNQIQKKILSEAGCCTFDLFISSIFLIPIGIGIIVFIYKGNIIKENISIDYSLLTLYLVIQLIIILIISFIVFYVIERQKPYQGLLKFDNIHYKEENEVFAEMVDMQAEKYYYNEKLSYVMPTLGFIILYFNAFLGFFPEIRFWSESDYLEYLNRDFVETIKLITICSALSRILCCRIVYQSAYNKMRNYLFWSIFTLVFPSIGMILVGSFYPMNNKKIICPECGKLKSRGDLYCYECLKKHEPKVENSNKDDDFF